MTKTGGHGCRKQAIVDCDKIQGATSCNETHFALAHIGQFVLLLGMASSVTLFRGEAGPNECLRGTSHYHSQWQQFAVRTCSCEMRH